VRTAFAPPAAGGLAFAISSGILHGERRIADDRGRVQQDLGEGVAMAGMRRYLAVQAKNPRLALSRFLGANPLDPGCEDPLLNKARFLTTTPSPTTPRAKPW